MNFNVYLKRHVKGVQFAPIQTFGKTRPRENAIWYFFTSCSFCFYVHPVWNELPAPTHFLVRTVESLLHQCSTVHRLHLCWLATNKKAFESWEAKSFLVALSKKFAGLERHRRCQLNQRGETKGAIWQQGTKSIDTACCVNL